MEQTKALDALEPFLALTKSASSPRAAADLITRATSAPNTYIFQELLQAPQIQGLRNDATYAPHLTLLEIFSFGTYNDYTRATNLPSLNAAQLQKLRQLTLLALAEDQNNLSYANVMAALELGALRDLESLVISCIYSGLISGTLDPYNKIVAVSSVAPLRDLAPGSVPGMLGTLRKWSERCDSTLADLSRQIEEVRERAMARWEDEREWEKRVGGAKKEEEGKGEGQRQTVRMGGGKRMQRAGEEMDVDKDEEREAKNKKRVTGSSAN